MRLFLDASVLLAASGSRNGASREIFNRALSKHWILISTPYAIEETTRNLSKLPLIAAADWTLLYSALKLMPDIFTLNRPVNFQAGKDRPILFSALAWADVLLTLDREDFASLIGSSFYDLLVLTPGMLLDEERAADVER